MKTMKDHISVCIPTYRRNKMLEHLLKNLALQETDGIFDFSIVVVDNDVTGPAREPVMRLKAELGLDITYDVEPEQTIPAARNHALRLARGNYIAIIDDDEFPLQHWLITMYRAIHAFDVDGALGPVHPFFDQRPPSWLIKGRFCERPFQHTGTLLYWDQTRTGNVLLKKDVFDKHNLCFDETFKTGGSDQAFFRLAIQAGCRFIAIEEASVYEFVPPERWTKSYYIKRALINGFNFQRYSIQQPFEFSKIASPIKSMAALLAYTIACPICAILGQHRLMQCLEKGTYHLSRVFAIFGIELLKKRIF
jgi:succinoglycan biosynthesis protein ExoM